MTETPWTAGPWHLCQHLRGIEEDRACGCGYRGVIFGPEHEVAMAICQPGHDPAPEGQEGTEPARYPREVEIANARLISCAPELVEALEGFVSYGCPVCSGDCGSANPPVMHCPMQDACHVLAKARGRA